MALRKTRVVSGLAGAASACARAIAKWAVTVGRLVKGWFARWRQVSLHSMVYVGAGLTGGVLAWMRQGFLEHDSDVARATGFFILSGVGVLAGLAAWGHHAAHRYIAICALIGALFGILGSPIVDGIAGILHLPDLDLVARPKIARLENETRRTLPQDGPALAEAIPQSGEAACAVVRVLPDIGPARRLQAARAAVAEWARRMVGVARECPDEEERVIGVLVAVGCCAADENDLRAAMSIGEVLAGLAGLDSEAHPTARRGLREVYECMRRGPGG
jgi:hypothetical protein